MDTISENVRKQITELVDTYRDRCLWFLREDYYPTGIDDSVRVLGYVQRYGDREAFCKAGVLLKCLSPHSNKPFAV